MDNLGLANKFRLVADNLYLIIKEAQVSALYELEANLKQRVFNDNNDVNGKSFGAYKSDAYKTFRKRLGKDISKKNLQLTDKMRFGIHVDEDVPALRFKDAEDAIKGRGQEFQLKTKIFEPSKEEEQIIKLVIEEQIYLLIEKTISA